MMKARKFAGTRLAPALLTCALLVSVVPGMASAASSFTPSSSNFRTVFDFDTVPAAYTEGYKPGTRSDTIGLGKSQKAITADGLGLTYDLTIVKNDALDGGLALQIDVKDLAPENGAYCPITLRPDYGDNLQTDVSGAEYFAFWVDTTGFIDQNGEKTVKRMDFYIQEMDVEADGSVSAESATAWRPDYKETTAEGPYYEYEDGKGGWLRSEDFTVLDFGLPVDYQGWVRFPIASLVHTDFSTTDTDGVFNGKQLTHVFLGLGNYAAHKGSVYLFDQIGFMGDFSSGSGGEDTTTAPPAGGEPVTEPDGNADSTTTADPDADPTTTAGGTDEDGKTSPTSRTTADDGSEPVGGGDGYGDGDGSGGSFPWGWIAAAAIVVVLAGGGVTLYLLYRKGKLPFGKSSGGDGE
ncbi:MAG TPA: hypothetical protein H9684_02030 [Firmicutes bacterium]|nr:hypothetical protein [Bacillota bacterium]